MLCGRSLFRRRFGLQTLWQLFPSSQPVIPMVERVKNWPTKTYVLCGLSWDGSKDFGGTGNHIPSVISSPCGGFASQLRLHHILYVSALQICDSDSRIIQIEVMRCAANYAMFGSC